MRPRAERRFGPRSFFVCCLWRRLVMRTSAVDLVEALPDAPRDFAREEDSMAAEYALVVEDARKTFRSARRSGPWWSVLPGKAARPVKEVRAVDDVSLRI